MAIKEVKNIPQARGKKSTQTQMARNDIKEAFDRRISKFEFEGNYNYKTLSSVAREQIHRYFVDNIYVPTVREVKNILSEEGYTDIQIPNGYSRGEHSAYEVYGVTGTDRKHVYVQIYFNYIDEFKDTLLRATKQANRRREV